MKFAPRIMITPAAEGHALALAVAGWVKDSTFGHPQDLLLELRHRWHAEGITAAQHNGIINVHGAHGILLRIKPI